MYCTNCGAEVNSGSAFCIKCGAKLSPQAPKAADGLQGKEPVVTFVDPARFSDAQSVPAAASGKASSRHVDIKKLKKLNPVLLIVFIAMVAAAVVFHVIYLIKINAPLPDMLVETATKEEINVWASALYKDGMEKLCELGIAEPGCCEDDFALSGDAVTYGAKDTISGGKFIIAYRESGYGLSVKSKYSYSTYASEYPDYPFYTPFNTDATYSDNITFARRFWAQTLDDCDYLLVINGRVSKISPNFYFGGIDRQTVTTEIICIAVHSREVVYIGHIGVDTPAANFAPSPRGEIKTEMAENEIRGLLCDIFNEEAEAANPFSWVPYSVRNFFTRLVVIDIVKLPVALIACIVTVCKESKNRKALKKYLADTAVSGMVWHGKPPVPRKTGWLAIWSYVTFSMLVLPGIFSVCSLKKINGVSSAGEQDDYFQKTVFCCLTGCILGMLILAVAFAINS